MSALLYAGYLTPISLSNSVTALQPKQAQPSQEPQTTTTSSSSSALLAFDTYTPGQATSTSTSDEGYAALFSYNAAAQASGSSGVSYASSVTSASDSDVPQAVLALLEGNDGSVQQSGSALTQNSLSGDSAAAQSSDNLLSAMGAAVSQVQQDETQSMQGVAQSGGLSSTDISQLAKDMANLDSAKKAASTNISNYLVAQGYSSSDAASYANALTDTSTTIATEIGSSVSSTDSGSSASASTQIGISVSEDAQGDLTLISTISTEASSVAQSAASAVNALDGAQTSASINVANWLVAREYQALGSSTNSSNSASGGSVSAYA